MSVQIIINGENAAESLNELSALASGLTGTAVAAVATAPEVPKTRQTRTKPETAKPEPKEEAPGVEEAGTKVEPETDEGEAGEPVTVEQLRAKAAAVAKSGKQANVKALLDEFGAKSITLVPEEQRSAFLARLETL